MKATEQYFPVILFIMLYKVVLTFESSDETLSVTIQMKATEQWFCLLCCTRQFKLRQFQLQSLSVKYYEIMKRKPPSINSQIYSMCKKQQQQHLSASNLSNHYSEHHCFTKGFESAVFNWGISTRGFLALHLCRVVQCSVQDVSNL